MNECEFESNLYDLHEEVLSSVSRTLDDLARIEREICAVQDRMWHYRDAVKKLSQRLIDEWERR